MTSSDPSSNSSFNSSPESAPNRNKSTFLIPLFIWAVFLSGLLLQLFSPHLRIDHDSFIMPPATAGEGRSIDPRELVRRERMIQLFSAFLSVTGAAGLALYYRRSLLSYLPGKR